MSQLRQPPVQVMAADAPTTSKPSAKKAPAKKPLSAAKVTSSAKRVAVPTRLDPKGRPVRCYVMVGRAQCSNPARHQHGQAWTCTTHDSQIAKGAKPRYARKVALWVNPAKPVTGKAAAAA
jgi:hypothetical protein